jgi:GGDEF domain-containing protein
MHDNVPHPYASEPRRLAIVALDIKRFSSFNDTEGTRVATEFRNCVESAFTGDLEGAWAERVFEQDAGDGIVVGFESRRLRDIVDLVPAALQQELRRLHQRTRLNVRMRMGIGVGSVQHTDDPRISTAPNRAIIDTCRIADSEPTRLLLENSDAHATYLAVGPLNGRVSRPRRRGERLSTGPGRAGRWPGGSRPRQREPVASGGHRQTQAPGVHHRDRHRVAILHVRRDLGRHLDLGGIGGRQVDPHLARLPCDERVDRS